MQERVQKAKQSLESAQCRQKASADQRRRALDLDIGSYVKLSTVNLVGRAFGTPQLHPKFIGPFQVAAKVGLVAYRLVLPEIMKYTMYFMCPCCSLGIVIQDSHRLPRFCLSRMTSNLRLKPSWITKMKARASAEKGHIWSLGEGIHLKMPHGSQNQILKTFLLPCKNTRTS